MSIISIINEFACFKKIQLFYVGGYVRDKYLNIESSDLDIVVFDIDYEKFAFMLAKRLNAIAVTFKDNVRLILGETIIDVSKPRGKDIYEDLNFRDFTINNLAIALDGSIIGDKGDIDNKIIRMVSEQSLIDDPLRILRAFRFYSTLGFSIDNQTYETIIREKNNLNFIAKERILEELKKLFGGKYFEHSLGLLITSGLLEIITSENEFDKSAVKLKSFPLQLARLIKNIDKLNLSNNDIKLIKLLWHAEDDYKILDDNVFAYRYYQNLDDVLTFLSSKYSDRLDNIKTLSSSLNMVALKSVNGETLKQMGLTPNKQFKIILDDVHEKLALNELELTGFQQYINRKYLDL